MKNFVAHSKQKAKSKEPNEKITDIYTVFMSIFCETKTCVEKTNRLQLIL